MVSVPDDAVARDLDWGQALGPREEQGPLKLQAICLQIWPGWQQGHGINATLRLTWLSRDRVLPTRRLGNQSV